MSKQDSLKGQESGKQYLKLLQMGKTYFTHKKQRYSVKDAPPDVFDQWIRGYVEEIINVDTFLWDLFDRWQIVNAVLTAGFLVIQDGELVRPKPEEKASTGMIESEEKSSELSVKGDKS